MKLSVIYDSVSGTTEACANYIVNGMQQVEGVEAKAFHINDVDMDYAIASDGLVFGTPTYMGGASANLYTWMEKNTKALKLSGKLGGAFATGAYMHGGENLATVQILIHLLVRGMMVYSGGNAHGKPVIHVGPSALSDGVEEFRELFELFGKRFATQAKAIEKQA